MFLFSPGKQKGNPQGTSHSTGEKESISITIWNGSKSGLILYLEIPPISSLPIMPEFNSKETVNNRRGKLENEQLSQGFLSPLGVLLVLLQASLNVYGVVILLFCSCCFFSGLSQNKMQTCIFPKTSNYLFVCLKQLLNVYVEASGIAAECIKLIDLHLQFTFILVVYLTLM